MDWPWPLHPRPWLSLSSRLWLCPPFSTVLAWTIEDLQETQQGPVPTAFFVFKDSEKEKRGESGVAGVSTSLRPTDCLTSSSTCGPVGSSCNQDTKVFCGTHPTTWLLWKPIDLCFSQEPKSTGTLEVFFCVVCGAGC